MFTLKRIYQYFTSPKPLIAPKDIALYYAQLSERGTQYLHAIVKNALQDHYDQMPSNEEIDFMLTHGLLRRVHRNHHDTILRPTAAVYQLLQPITA